MKVTKKLPGKADIFEAILKFDLEKVRFLIAAGTDVNASCKKGEDKGAPPLLVAVLSNSWQSRGIIIELIKAGARKENVDDPKIGFTPLHHAANIGIWPAAWALLISGANPEITDKVGRTPLHYAAMKGFAEICQLTILAGANPGRKASVDGHTAATYAAMAKGIEFGDEVMGYQRDYLPNKDLFALFAAIMKGDEGSFDEKVARIGAGKTAPETGLTPLIVAAIAGKRRMAEKLIGMGAGVEAADKKTAFTAYQYAAMYGNVDVVDLLATKGANVNARDTLANTPLVNAIMFSESISTIRKLIAAGANVNSKNSYGETPLYVAAGGQSLEVVKLLLDAGADINMKTKDGGTVLHAAARTRNPAIIEELVKKGADLHAAMNDGWQAVHVTGEAGNLETLKTMLKLGADKKAKTKDGKTVMDIAFNGGFDELVTFLQKKKR